jgi:hypothetical protein
MVYLTAWDEPTDMKPPDEANKARFKKSLDIYNENMALFVNEKGDGDNTTFFEGVESKEAVGFVDNTGRKVTSDGIISGENDKGFNRNGEFVP